MASLSNLVPAPDSSDEWLARPGAIQLANTYPVPGATKFALLTTASSSPWTVPSDWSSSNNTIWAIGAGGNGAASTNSTNGGGGGGGGACAVDVNLTLTPSGSVNFQIGAHGGTVGSGTAPTANTWFKDGSTLVAAGGATPSAGSITGGAAGSVGNSVVIGGGSFRFAGGAGGNGATNGGGGAGGGGGGAGGNTAAGTAGTTATSGTGGVGGQGDGATGGAGGGAHTAGSAGTEIADSTGAGGGGGGGNITSNTAGGAGGNYGAGGGGAGQNAVTTAAGTDGVIIISYTTASTTEPMLQVTCLTVVGNLIVGMMNDPAGSGYDIPFVYNLQSNSFETVTGVTVGTNTPTSPSGAGAWQPPHVEMVGYYALIAHPGYTQQTSSMFFGAVDLAPLVLPQKTVILTSGTSWIVPSDWNNSANRIQCIGSGATGSNGGSYGSSSGAGGNGGGYGGVINQTASGTVSIQIGTGGTPTWWSSSGTVQGAGGSSGSNVGTTTFTGGLGGGGTSGGANNGGGGGGAAGPNGNGVNGVTGGAGGAGDAGFGGAGGGPGPNNGAAGTEIGTTGVGSGGGGGCGGAGGIGIPGGAGGKGGAYGAGGGGGGSGAPGGAGAAGSQGIIIIYYTPVQAALTYTVQNTTTNALISPPVWITQFNSRAYFFCNPGGTNAPALYCSDNFAAGGPLSRSSAVAGVILTFGDNVNLIGGGVLSLTNISTGGVTQALFVFKQAGGGSTNMFQVTGDVGTTNLTVQAMNTSVSTSAPNSIVSTPKGLFFIALDGMRYVDTGGNVMPPIGFDGQGIAIPFLYSSTPSRICAAFNANTIRVVTQNGNIAGSPIQDWCYDIVRNCWYGPHTFPVDLISSWGNTFIVTPTAASGQVGLYESDLVPSTSSVYTELSAAITCTFASGFFPDRKESEELSSTLGVFYQGGKVTFTIQALDSTGAVINNNSVTLTPTSAAQISAAIIPWVAPLIFDRMQVKITAIASSGLRLGDFMLEYEQEAYTVGPA